MRPVKGATEMELAIPKKSVKAEVNFNK